MPPQDSVVAILPVISLITEFSQTHLPTCDTAGQIAGGDIDLSTFFEELRRRNVFRIAGVYAVVGWLIIQLGIALETTLNLPSWFDTLLTVLVLIGFPFALLFAWAFELTPEGMKRTDAVNAEDSITTKTSRKLDYAILGGLALVAGLMVFQSFRSSPTTPNNAPQSIEIPEASIAVLPFADLSSDGSQEYFGDGIAEELLNVLAKIEEMQVAGRTSSFAFKGKNEDLREIGRVLNVAHILEGSIRKSGERVRVTAQLIKVDDGFHLWSETYDRDLDDIFAVQDDISREISLALMPHLMGDQVPTIAETPRTDVSAYSKFLEARELVRSRNVANIEKAQTLLDEVIETDPSYAPAYALQAQVALLLSNGSGAYGTVPVAEARQVAETFIEKALSLDPNLGEAYAARGLGLSYENESEPAIAALRRAVELSPNNLDANMWLAFELQVHRRHLDTVDALIDIFNKDPLFAPIATNLVIQLRWTGQLDRAEEVVARLQNIAPESRATKAATAMYNLHTGEIAAAVEGFQELYTATPGLRNGLRVSDALMELDAFEEIRKYESFPIYEVWATILEGNTEAGVIKMKALLDSQPEDGLLKNEYLIALSRNNQDAEILTYFKETWGSVRDFEADVFDAYSGIPPRYSQLAFAFRELGEEALFDETMQRWRTSIDIDRAGGHKRLFQEEAQWQTISGNFDEAIAQLEMRFEADKYLAPWRLEGRWFRPLQDIPAFKELKAKSLIRVNEERAKLGLSALAD